VSFKNNCLERIDFDSSSDWRKINNSEYQLTGIDPAKNVDGCIFGALGGTQRLVFMTAIKTRSRA
jgi:hypothetical protein